MTVQLEPWQAVEAPRLRDLIEARSLSDLLDSIGSRVLVVVDVDGVALAGRVEQMVEGPELAALLARFSRRESFEGGGRVVEAVPLFVRDHFLGALLSLGEVERRSFPGLLPALGRVIESWAHNGYELRSLTGELVWRYEELSVLSDACETIVSVMDLDEVSKRILAKASDMLDVDNASLMLLDPDTQTLTIQEAIGLERSLVEGIKLRVGEEISGWVAREGRPLLIEDIEKHELFRKVNQERYINRSLLSVPLKVRDRVIGVLNVSNKRTGQVFSSGDLKLLSSLASLAAISIENARTYKNAITDRLTRLYNYGYFREELARRLGAAVEEDMPVSLLMFDIDHFKNFNDKNGHELANVALVRIASICMENCRQKGDRIPDVVARYGGEEFMILLYGVPADQAFTLAERIRQAIEGTDFKGMENQPGGRVTVSIGVSAFPKHAADGDELVNEADKALYRAKKAGRNNVQIAGDGA